MILAILAGGTGDKRTRSIMETAPSSITPTVPAAPAGPAVVPAQPTAPQVPAAPLAQ
jgi:hypothetical protein